MAGLFDNDEAFMQAEVKKKRKLVRNRKGRFCSEEQKRIEQIEHENVVLKRKAEMFFRNWQAVGDRAIRLDRENHDLKNKIKELNDTIKEYGKSKKTKRPAKRR